MNDKMRYLVVVHDVAWKALEDYFDARGIDLMPIPKDEDADPDDGTHYFLAPRRLQP